MMVGWFGKGESGFLCLNSANTDENLGMLYKGDFIGVIEIRELYKESQK